MHIVTGIRISKKETADLPNKKFEKYIFVNYTKYLGATN